MCAWHAACRSPHLWVQCSLHHLTTQAFGHHRMLCPARSQGIMSVMETLKDNAEIDPKPLSCRSAQTAMLGSARFLTVRACEMSLVVLIGEGLMSNGLQQEIAARYQAVHLVFLLNPDSKPLLLQTRLHCMIMRHA